MLCHATDSTMKVALYSAMLVVALGGVAWGATEGNVCATVEAPKSELKPDLWNLGYVPLLTLSPGVSDTAISGTSSGAGPRTCRAIAVCSGGLK